MPMHITIAELRRAISVNTLAAIADYDTAIRLKPDYAKAYNNRGLAKDNLGQHLAAIADYDTAIRLKPDLAEAYYNRGIAKYNLGQYSAAIADYDTAIRLKPDLAAGILQSRSCEGRSRSTLCRHRRL